ncbi:MAG: hypothetical protein ABL868_04360 [Sulfuriferula sp.]
MSKAGLIRGSGITAIIISYAILANYTNQSPHTGTLGVLVALAPIALAGLMLAWHAPRRYWMLGLMASSASILLWLTWPVLTQHYGWIYWLEHESLQSALLIMFARTLHASQQPLCTQFATIIHGELTPIHSRYTYQITVAWVLFFALMIAISTGLFFTQPVAIWSIFANFIFMPLVILMFIAEYGVRKLIHPALAEVSIMAAVHAFMRHSASRR